MSKKRVYELAKDQGISSKELLEKLHAAGIEAKAAASTVEEDIALKVLGGSNGAGVPRPCQANSQMHGKAMAAPRATTIQPKCRGLSKA